MLKSCWCPFFSLLITRCLCWRWRSARWALLRRFGTDKSWLRGKCSELIDQQPVWREAGLQWAADCTGALESLHRLLVPSGKFDHVPPVYWPVQCGAGLPAQRLHFYLCQESRDAAGPDLGCSQLYYDGFKEERKWFPDWRTKFLTLSFLDEAFSLLLYQTHLNWGKMALY